MYSIFVLTLPKNQNGGKNSVSLRTSHKPVLEGGAPVLPEVELFSNETLGERMGEEASSSEHVMNMCDVTGIYQSGPEDLTDWVQQGPRNILPGKLSCKSSKTRRSLALCAGIIWTTDIRGGSRISKTEPPKQWVWHPLWIRQWRNA